MQSMPWNGQRIAAPGIYRHIPLDDYHRADICDGVSVSSSMLRGIDEKSPAHFFARAAFNPNRIIQKETDAYRLGRLLHLLIEGVPFNESRYIIRPERAPDGRDWHHANKTCIKWMADARERGQSVVSMDDVEQAKGMMLALGKHPMVMQGLLAGDVERSLFWKKHGYWIKARPDNIPNDSGDFVDLKTTESVLYRDCQRSIINYGYHMQGAMILEAARALGIPASSFTLVWVEKNPPYCVRVQTLRDEDLLRGEKQNELALRTFMECYEAKHWPGPGDDHADAEYIDLPDWYRKSVDDRINYQLREAA
ncbi:PD-(D/E)XK nuclease-like domain-containing protein [Bradyrhizobium valentinum]|uniref:Putative exodeoxyribonuclease 8 PDDEXK-like domain-containing protein n=1 Tax=Bradyrhizobium valentinum TaxID=1518501 RepID=A0A0R3KUQ8_9BRAD|nr:PD-(D/E)XK nuclease-like domain-containing protein [Bradyrhizobium valentinum]KRQ99248.1 hypothetical protein CP49_11665 [Bradyrhizobium valentinum]